MHRSTLSLTALARTFKLLGHIENVLVHFTLVVVKADYRIEKHEAVSSVWHVGSAHTL